MRNHKSKSLINSNTTTNNMKEQQKALINHSAVFLDACITDQPYEPPTIEVVEITLEKGFAGSGSTTDWENDTW